MYGHAARLARFAADDPACVESPAHSQLVAEPSDGVDLVPGLLLVELTTEIMSVRTAVRDRPWCAISSASSVPSFWSPTW